MIDLVPFEANLEEPRPVRFSNRQDEAPPVNGGAHDGLDLPITFAWTLAGQPVPPRRWIVPDWLPRHQVTLLTGDGGTGKSLLALQLMVACATGARWVGLDVEQVGSFGVFAEDDDAELHIRLASICQSMGVPIADVRDMAWRSAVIDPCEMVEISDRGLPMPTRYYEWIEKTVDELGVRIVVLDAATNLFGGDEIKRRQVNAFLVMLRRLAIKIDGAVLLLAHPSVSGMANKSGISGSTHWGNGVRSRLYLTHDDQEDADPNVRVLARKKANYASVGDTLRMRWTAGAFTSLGGPEPMDKAELSAKADSVFLGLLAKIEAEGVTVCPSLTARNYAPAVFAKHPSGQAMPKKAFEGAMQRLLKAGAITIAEYGKPSDRRKKLVLA